MAARAGRGPYAKSAGVRSRIVDACIDAFAASGFQGSTMAGIARRAGLSHTGLLHHFPTKEDLLLAVLERLDEQRAESLAAAGARDPSANPLDMLTGMIDLGLARDRAEGLLELDAVLSGEASVPGHPAHEALADRYTGIRQFYARAFEALRRDGRLRTPLDPDTLATMFLALVGGLQLQWLYDRESIDVTRMVNVFLATIVGTD